MDYILLNSAAVRRLLLVYGSDRELRARVPALWPWTGRAGARVS
jgi:hypothetical protein